MNKIKPNTPKEIIELMQQAPENPLYKATCLSSGYSTEVSNPVWNFGLVRYELVKEKPSINWDHVEPQYNYMATDDDGASFLFTHKPILRDGYWDQAEVDCSDCCPVSGFRSYKVGTCSWKDSLVERPALEAVEELFDVLFRL